MGRQFIEALDRRAMLSVALDGSSLKIAGTESADDIAVMADARFINILDASVNGVTSYYSLTSISQISIDAGGGDDRITVDPALDLMAYPTSITGGDGNDRITTGAGNDTIDAGSGNDKIYSNGGNDSVIGGSGNDTIYGGAGNDILSGGLGNDRIVGEAGNDVCDAGKGNDNIDAGDGDDVIKSAGGNLTAFAGDGNDSGNIKSAGIVYAQDGNDVFVSTGGALLYGGDGNDNLQGTSVWGDAGDDTLTGLNGADEIHGGDGNDLIRGMDGNDILIGDAGDDAIFGGGGTDTLYGRDGNDNLYGTDGAKDKHKDLAGRDDVYGGAGSDWFETAYPWNKGDYHKGVDRAPNAQNILSQDPSYGLYANGTLAISDNNGQGSYTSGFMASSGTLTVVNSGSGGLIKIGSGTDEVGETDPLSKVGFISTGMLSTDQQSYVPPSLTHAQRLAIRSGILELPSSWQIGAITPAADGVVWYAITNAPREITTVQDAHLSITSGYNSGLGVGGIITNSNSGLVSIINGSTVIYTSGTVASGTNTPLSGGAVPQAVSLDPIGDHWRFVAVKKGTVLLSDAGHDVNAAKPLGIDTAILPITTSADIRLAGSATVYHTAATFDSLPTGGPAGTRGILLSDGMIWLSADGSGAYSASGK